MLIDLTSDELAFIREGIRVGQFESVLPERGENELMDGLMNKLNMDEWMLVHGENYFTLIEQYQCSECSKVVSGGPPETCPQCWAKNVFRGKVVNCRLEGEED